MADHQVLCINKSNRQSKPGGQRPSGRAHAISTTRREKRLMTHLYLRVGTLRFAHPTLGVMGLKRKVAFIPDG